MELWQSGHVVHLYMYSVNGYFYWTLIMPHSMFLRNDEKVRQKALSNKY